jgi:hypothetical protein
LPNSPVIKWNAPKRKNGVNIANISSTNSTGKGSQKILKLSSKIPLPC